MDLLKIIKDKIAIPCVIGLGYAGLPLAVEFARTGFNVIGIDLDKNKVDAINRGESYIGDAPSEELQGLSPQGTVPEK